MGKQTKIEEQKLTSSQLILGLAEKYDGDYNRILAAVAQKEMDGLESYVAKNTKPYITMLDQDYPETLKRKFHSPLILYYKGVLALLTTIELKKLGVVTCRNIDNDLRAKAYNIIQELPTNIVIVTSNEVVAQMAINSQKPHRVILVLACGLNKTTPGCGEEIKKAVLKNGGLIITTKPQDSTAVSNDFVRKNHLIATVSDAMLGIQLKLRSGSEMAIHFALTNGADIMVLPTLPDTPECVNNTLIKEGAILVENARDIKEVLFNE